MAKEYTRDASEYGQKLIADAIRSLGSISSGGGSSTPTSENGSDAIKVDVEVIQSENQTITYYPIMVSFFPDDPELAYSLSTNMGLGSQVSDNASFHLGVVLQVDIIPSEGYTAGELVCPNGIVSGIYNHGGYQGSALCPLGTTITLSATPATIE